MSENRRALEGIVVPTGGKPVVAAVDALGALREVVAAAREYGLVRETEQSRRAQIKAVEHVEVTKIKAAEEVLRQYFDRVFAERAITIDEMFDRLDGALQGGDPQMVHAVVRGIVDVAQSSPLAGLEDFGKFWAELGGPENPVEL